MTTKLDEIGPGIYRLSTFAPNIGPSGLTFNQFLLVDDEPLLFHTGHRSMFDSVREAIERVIPVDRLRWIAFGHVESDECGAMNEFLGAAPGAQVAHGALGCMVQARRDGGSAAPTTRRRGGGRARNQAGPPHRHPPRSPWVGCRGHVRGDDQDSALRGPLHPSR